MSLELFRSAGDYACGVLSDLQDGDLALATPCGGWHVSTVARHIADVADALTEPAATGQLSMPDSPRCDSDDPVAVALAAVNNAAGTLAATESKESVETACRAGAIEFTAHGWDIAVACDQNHQTPEQLSADVLALAATLIQDDARGENFAAPVELPSTASASDHLAAFLKRRPA